jgi:hypothetical protein
MEDASLSDRQYLPTLEVYGFDPTAFDSRPDDGSAAESDADPVSDEVERRLHALAARHRRDLVVAESEDKPEQDWHYSRKPPLLTAFVILQHMIMVVNLDSSHPDNDIVVFCEMDLSMADQWLWNALALALPVHMARDALWDLRHLLPEADTMNVDDPDV